MQLQMQQQTCALASSQSNNPPPPSSLRSRSPVPPPLPSPLSLGPAQARQPSDHVIGQVVPIAAARPSGEPAALSITAALARVRVSDIACYDGAPTGVYLKAVEALSGSLMRHNAAVIELGNEDTALMRCGLESARLFFRSRAQIGSGSTGGTWGKTSRGVYVYRAGRALEDSDSSPPCMADVFRCMGKAARSALSAIARHLRLRSEAFNHLLDDTPLPANEESSSVLVATYSNAFFQNNKGANGGGKPGLNGEFEKGLLTLISSDSPGLQVCDPNGHWYLADGGSCPGELLLLTGKALSHATAGLRPATSYRAASDYSAGTGSSGRTSLAFRLMPQGNAILDCSPIAAAGHVIPQSYVPVSVSQFMDDLSAEEDVLCNPSDSTNVAQNNSNRELTLRSVLSDPLSGSFLEDAVVVSCGHSFGGLMLRRVIEASRCTLCNAEIETGSLVPNHALRAAAAAVKHEDDCRLFHNAALRKRRKELGDETDPIRRLSRENGGIVPDNGLHRGETGELQINLLERKRLSLLNVSMAESIELIKKISSLESALGLIVTGFRCLLKIIGTGERVFVCNTGLLEKLLSFSLLMTDVHSQFRKAVDKFTFLKDPITP
ncbi:hypothetical protein RJ641_003641 [Dillenia turbinata]|uniref:U-box domain-containing protein 62 n=1 Tax=Dillenia turbinata TaxID=194707 RepID=A0AAN8ZFD8_9MAGN